jgi:hypothetical protein
MKMFNRHRVILALTIAFCLCGIILPLPGLASGEKLFTYVSPKPGTVLVSRQTTLISGHSDAVEPSSYELSNDLKIEPARYGQFPNYE